MSRASSRDFYRILQVNRTATAKEIKSAYRKIAQSLHPDKHGGCQIKSEEFKLASEAYETLSSHSKRNEYDRMLLGRQYVSSASSYSSRAQAHASSREKIYAPRPPPGFKRFDHDKFYRYHYGNGIFEEEIEFARKRAENAGSKEKHHSPLGDSFNWTKRDREGQGHRFQRAKQSVVDRLHERRANRRRLTEQQNTEYDSCAVM